MNTYIATCPGEIQEVVAKELESLGAVDVTQGYKAVNFKADDATAMGIHLQLSTASRILRFVKSMPAQSDKILENQSGRIKWQEIFPANATYVVEGVAGDRGDDALTSNGISKAVRLGLENYFQNIGVKVPKVDLKEPDITIVAYVHQKRCILSIDTSGKSLHKRGYRLEGHPAPLKENLAAAILKMAGYSGSEPLFDPMCGSGTLAIEGAFMALKKAPLIHRKKNEFGFERLAKFDSKTWREVQDKHRQDKLEDLPFPIFAGDINGDFVEAAKRNALRARVEKFLTFNTGSFFDAPAPASSGLLVANLPYGTRIEQHSHDDIKEFYQALGDTLKQKYSGWRAAFLVPEESPFKFIGLRPKRKIPFLNGAIPCRLLMFEIYSGTKRNGPAQEAEGAETDA